MLYIFNTNEELIDIIERGDILSAVHEEYLRGENILVFSVPGDSPKAQYVVEGVLVGFKDLDGIWQLFEITQIADEHSDTTVREAYCEHIFYELINDVIKDRRPYDVTAHFALTQALLDTRWEPGTVADPGTKSTNFYYESALASLHKIVTIWDLDPSYDITISNNTITERKINLGYRGADTGKQFVYGKDIRHIKRTVDTSSLYTAMYGRGKGEELEEGVFGRRTTFANIVWETPGDPADKPAEQEWVGDTEALGIWGRPGSRHRYGVYDDPDETDPETLLEKTWAQLQKQKIPYITYELDVVTLEHLAGYAHETVRLGDTIRTIDREFVPELAVAVRVIQLERDLLNHERTKAVLGNRPLDLHDAMTDSDLLKIVRGRLGIWDEGGFDGPVPTDWLEGVIDTLQNEITAGLGTVGISDDGIMIIDDAEDPTKALVIVNGIMGAANSKDPVTGEWEWRTFVTGNGLVADELKVGKIRTNLVEIFGDTYFYWDHSNIFVIDPDDVNKQIRIGKYDGTNYGIGYTSDGGTNWNTVLDHDGIYIGSGTNFASGYDPSEKVTSDEATTIADASVDEFKLGQYAADYDYLEGLASGAIMTWFYPHEPTLANLPASEWTTDDEKNNHLGDLFYDTETGYSYRFAYSGGVYQWIRIVDADLEEALQLASQAQDTADQKRRIFTVQPYTPYEVGDLWAQGSTGELMRCMTARATGSYVAGDWELAAKYTDDSALLAHNNDQSPHTLPSYVKLTNIGLRCFDTSNNERARFGHWTDSGNRYGVRVIAEDGSTVLLDDRGIMQTWQEGRADNVDSNNRLVLYVYLPTETRSVKKSILRFRILNFRSYSSGAAHEGGSVQSTSTQSTSYPTTTSSGSYGSTTSSGGGTYTSTSSGGSTTTTSAVASFQLYSTTVADYLRAQLNHNHGIPHNTGLRTADGGTVWFAASGGHNHLMTTQHRHSVSIGNHSHTISIGTHSHSFSVPNHNHSVTISGHGHSVSIPHHTHNLVHGIYNSTTAYGVRCYINGTDRTSVLGGPWNTSRDNLNITAYLALGQWNTIELSSTRLGRMDATVFIQALMNA